MANFLAEEYDVGKQYRTINVYRSALSTTLPPAHGSSMGKHPDVRRVMRGVYHCRPPQPRYRRQWDVAAVLAAVKTWGNNTAMLLSDLTWKLTLLMALAKAPRASELHALDCRYLQRLPDGVLFLLTELTKTQRGGGPQQFFLASFSDDADLCPVRCLDAYLARTAALRQTEAPAQPLLIAVIRPHRGVTTDTISRWLKAALAKAGVDTSEFSGHSTRGASTSTARESGVTMADVLAAADWSRPSTFVSYYYRPHVLRGFTRAVLGQARQRELTESD